MKKSQQKQKGRMGAKEQGPDVLAGERGNLTRRAPENGDQLIGGHTPKALRINYFGESDDIKGARGRQYGV